MAAALGHRGAAVLADNAVRGLELLEHARTTGLGSLVVLVGRDPAELVRSMPVVPLDELLASAVPAVTEEGFGYDPQRRELWFAGETAEAFQLELEAQARRLREEATALAEQAAAATPAMRPPDQRLLSLCQRLCDELARAARETARVERPLAESAARRAAP